jgi:hypothetical protein
MVVTEWVVEAQGRVENQPHNSESSPYIALAILAIVLVLVVWILIRAHSHSSKR